MDDLESSGLWISGSALALACLALPTLSKLGCRAPYSRLPDLPVCNFLRASHRQFETVIAKKNAIVAEAEQKTAQTQFVLGSKAWWH